MKTISTVVLGLALMTAMASPGAAHTLEELQEKLGEREVYFQPIDREAPGFRLEDADGREVGLADLRGKVVVLHFIYTNCPDVCPLHAERIAEIQAMINQTPMRELVRFVTITTDPGTDTAEVMRDYGKAHGLDPANWTFLTSGPDEPEATRALAERFGHRFTRGADGYQMHGVVTHVLDGEGRWQANFHGLQFHPTSLVVFVNALTNVNVPHGHEELSLWDNPYRLARDIRGIGFRTADQIAARLGIEKTALVRVRAGISYALAEAMDDGHCGLPVDDLIALCRELLAVPADVVATALGFELQAGGVVADDVEGTRCVFLAGLWLAERAIADRLKGLSSGAPPWPSIEAENAMAWVEARPDSRMRRARRQPCDSPSLKAPAIGPRCRWSSAP